jgi:hypothetical protein
MREWTKLKDVPNLLDQLKSELEESLLYYNYYD